jgi:hypothetical protein
MVQNFFAHRCSSEGSADPRQIGESRDYLPTHFEVGPEKVFGFANEIKVLVSGLPP